MATSGASTEAYAASRIWAVTGVPLGLLLVASALLVVQIVRMNESSAWVEHSEEALALCSRIERQIHRERAARLEEWLHVENAAAAANDAREALRNALDSAQRHVADNESQLERLAEVRTRYRSWESVTNLVPAPGHAGNELAQAIAASDTLLGSTLKSLGDFEREERRLRALRAEKFDEVKAVWLYGALPLLMGLALTIAYSARQQILRLVREFNQAFAGQAEANERVETKRWVRDVLRGLAVRRGESELAVLGKRLLRDAVTACGAQVGALYIGDGRHLKLLAGYGLSEQAPSTIEAGVGAAGVALGDLKPTIVTGLAGDQLRLESAIVNTGAATAAFIPCHHSDRVLGLMELGFLGNMGARTLQLVDLLGETVGTSLVIVEDQERLKHLLLESQVQAEALQTQQQAQRKTNEELAAQTAAAKAAQTQLEERKELLETVNHELVRQRDALGRAQQTLQQRAVDLGRADRYKSEFLASMSHELRTPLNSILILADALAENRSGNLTAQQVKFASTIGSSGNDLLALINDVLDLSKIEAGAMEFDLAEAGVEEIIRPVIRIMDPLVRERGLRLIVPSELPQLSLYTDVRRAQQILKNLLSNACKFTPSGTVSLTLLADEDVIRISVEDTGIGIAAEDADLIFEPFRQGEGAPNRRFSGTGLGLSISRDLARKLGGDVVVESELGNGSKFTLSLGRKAPVDALAQPKAESAASHSVAIPEHFGASGACESPVVLLVTGDVVLVQLASEAVRAVGFECVSANSAEASVALAESTSAVAVVLDVALRNVAGEEVALAVKEASSIGRLPQLVVDSGAAEPLPEMITNFLEGLNPPLSDRAARVPVSVPHLTDRELFEGKTILLVDDDVRNVFALTSVLEDIGIRVVVARNGIDAVAIAQGRDDLALVLMDLMMPGMDGFEATRQIRKLDGRVSLIPIIALTAKAMLNDRDASLEAGASEHIAKPVDTERLLALMRIWLQDTGS